ncbi:MAG TPA: ABC transporter substrate-binding protein [Frankiaceae bacterium]|jgi:peptide/nickel transport system substrate-binding protein|nr:ABC transporter substrate-binding protein [Frankiaceae bacterium]
MKYRQSTLGATIAGAATIALVASACGAKSGGGGASTSGQSGVLTIGMTASDIPSADTVLASGQGYEGYRFVGNSLYDSLTKYDLKQGDKIPSIVGGLATSWTHNATATAWTFKLRSGVSFSDGTPFNADAVLFNLDRYTNKKSPNYYAPVAASAALSVGSITSYKKIDSSTVEIDTAAPASHLPSDVVFLYMASPTAVKKYGNVNYANHPAGTGPFTMKSLTRGQQMVLAANPKYWGGAPKVSEVILKPIPDSSTRLAALKSGEVNWIEAPDPDTIASLKSSGFQVFTNSYDHVWPWIFNEKTGPLSKLQVRQALNYGIDRQTMATDLLQGTADPAFQVAPKASLAYQQTNNVYSYNPTKAKQLLAQAGYPNGFKLTVSYPTSGSGNMQPGPMNQELQSDLAKIGVKVELKPIEWAAMLTSFTAGKIPDNADAINISLTFIQESFWGLLFSSQSPLNIGHYADPAVDALIAKSATEADDAARNATYSQMAALITKDAPWLFVVNDRNPRVLASNVKGFIEPKSWFVDLTTVSVS